MPVEPVPTLRGLRVLLVGPVPPPAGGMAGQTLQLCELLRDAGASVELLPTNAPYKPAWLGQIRGVRAIARLLPYLWRLWRGCARSDVVHLMANSGWSWHLFCAPAIWVAWLRRTPIVVNYRGGEADAFLSRSASSVRAAMRRAACLVVPSGFLEHVFAKHGMSAQVVPNIIDLQRFHPAAKALPGDERRMMVARNLEPIYDNATAIKAFARVVEQCPEVRLTIAGTGAEATALEALAVQLGIANRVDFAGRVERNEMAARLRQCSIAINPSLVDNMPNSVLEALASGVPVVSTRVGGVPYIVEDGSTALLVPAGDADAMAAAILRLLKDPDLAERLVRAGLRDVARYTWTRVGPVLAEVYRASMAGRARPPVTRKAN
ncbi:MAG: glycosyltransferase family 4 protein [Rhodoferax sp.]|nr:glycosyltransferase family 4 protein [Rhodoferax sp.]